MKEFAVSEKEITASEKVINEYKQKAETNKVRLAEAEKEAEGRERIDVEALENVSLEQDKCVKENRESVRYHHRNHCTTDSTKKGMQTASLSGFPLPPFRQAGRREPESLTGENIADTIQESS